MKILFLLCGLIECTIIVYYSLSILNSKLSALKTWVIFALIYISFEIVLFPIWNNISIRTAITISSTILLFTFLFKDKFFKKLFVFFTYLFCVIFSEALILMTAHLLGIDLNSLYDFNFAKLIFTVISYCMFFCTSMLSIKIWKRKIFNENENPINYIAAYAVTQFIILFIVNSIIVEYKIHSILLIVFIFLVMAISIIIGIALTRSLKGIIMKKAENQHISEQLELYSQHFEEINTHVMDYRRLKHDFYDHIKVINGLNDNGKTEQVRSYIEEMRNKMESIENTSFCKNSAVDVLLFSKSQMAKSLGIRTEFLIDDNLSMPLSDMNMCSIVSNLMDNAIRSANAFNGIDKYIFYENYSRAGQFVIVIKNSSNPVENLNTTKENKQEHGLGIKIIKSILEKYNGNAIFKYEDGEFISIVNLNLQNIQKSNYDILASNSAKILKM